MMTDRLFAPSSHVSVSRLPSFPAIYGKQNARSFPADRVNDPPPFVFNKNNVSFFSDDDAYMMCSTLAGLQLDPG